MIILGANNDDRGAQLEDFTKRVLAKLGYSDIVTNVISSGGHEIDVRANFAIPHPGGQVTSVSVICECKAKASPVDTTEWMKFLGKIFVARASSSSDVHGMLVALNGVNGNVAGSYDDLKKTDSTVCILDGERLVKALRDTFEIVDREEVSRSIKRFTQRAWAQFDPAFNSGKVYWIVRFEDTSCTLLTGTGKPPSDHDLNRLKESVLTEVASKEFVDLNAESLTRERVKKAGVEIMVRACESGGIVHLSEKLDGDWTDNERLAAISALSEQGFLEGAGENHLLLNFGALGTREEHERFATRFLYLLHSGLHPEQLIRLAKCPHHDRFINDEFLSFVSERQANLPIPAEHRTWILDSLRIFPNALAYALTADPIIVTHRKEARQPDSRMDQADFVRFANELMRCVDKDFSVRNLSQYPFEVRKVRELDVTRRVVLKGDKAAMHTIEVRNRTGVGQVSEEHGGGYLHILVFNDSPEPWEWAAKAADKPLP